MFCILEFELAKLIGSERVLFNVRTGNAVGEVDRDKLEQSLSDPKTLASTNNELARVDFLEVNRVAGGIQSFDFELAAVEREFAVLARDQQVPGNRPSGAWGTTQADSVIDRDFPAALVSRLGARD